MALPRQPPAQLVVVGDVAVVDDRDVGERPRPERVAVGDVDQRLGRHAGVADGVAALEALRAAAASTSDASPTSFTISIERPIENTSVVGHALDPIGERRPGRRRSRCGRAGCGRCATLLADARRRRASASSTRSGVSPFASIRTRTHVGVGLGRAVEGDAGGVGATPVQRREHVEHGAADGPVATRVLVEESTQPAHGDRSFRDDGSGGDILRDLRRVCGSARRAMQFPWRLCADVQPTRGRRPCGRHPAHGLEQRQVAVDLPRRDLLVVGLPLVLLGLDEVVDVVLGAGVAERLRG